MDFFGTLLNIEPENEMFKNIFNSLSIESLWLQLSKGCSCCFISCS